MNIKIKKSDLPCIVDEEDFQRISAFNWFLNPGGYVQVSIHGKSTTLHRMVMGDREGFQIDHINGDKLDNRRCNLRFVKILQNVWNSGPRVTSHTGVKGVGWHKRIRKFQARANHLGKMYHFGYFNDIEEARQAYNENIVALRGEYARLA